MAAAARRGRLSGGSTTTATKDVFDVLDGRGGVVLNSGGWMLSHYIGSVEGVVGDAAATTACSSCGRGRLLVLLLTAA